MRKGYLLLAVVTLAAFVPMSANAALPFTMFGSVGFAKDMESGAPGGGLGLGVGGIYPIQNTQFAIGADIDYLMLGKKSESISDLGGTFSADVKLSAIPVTAQGYYMIPVAGNVAPYVDLGLGLYNWRVKSEAHVNVGGFSSSGSSTASETDFGFNLGGGLKFGKADSKMAFGADAKYHIISTSGSSTSLITVFGRVFFQ